MRGKGKGKQGKEKEENDVNHKGCYVLLLYIIVKQVSSGDKEMKAQLQAHSRSGSTTRGDAGKEMAIETGREKTTEQIAQEIDEASKKAQQALQPEVSDLPEWQKRHI